MAISTIIPTYNRRAYIRRAVDSVFAQTIPVDEIIVVDDLRSSDKLEDAIAEWYGRRVRVLKAAGGLSGARRVGVQEAKCDWIAFLDSDDEWTPDRNATLAAAASRLPDDVAWLFGDMRVVTDEGDKTTLFGEYGLQVTESPQIFSDSLRVQYPFMFGLLQASLIRRDVLVQLECFTEGLRSSEDLLAAFQVACRYKFAAVPSVVGRRILTSDLRSSSTSASAAGVFGPDYFRARMLAFSLVIQSGRKHPWSELYAGQVHGFCKALARHGAVPRSLAIEQFRYGRLSAKGLAFFCAVMLGRRTVQAWSAVAAFRRKHLKTEPSDSAKQSGHRAWARSLANRQI